MAKLYPWDARDRGGADLSEIFGSVVGEFVREIRYVVPHGEDWPEGHGESRVHEVDMAVELVMESGFSVVLSWEMDGPSEGLAIESKNSTELDELPGDGIDVSGHADWSAFLGRSIVGVNVAWHVPDEGCPDMPWSFRFSFTEESSIVIALGESTQEGEIEYSPDSLVVILDEETASSYRVPASATSSRGVYQVAPKH